MEAGPLPPFRDETVEDGAPISVAGKGWATRPTAQ
jgi:hypothetical protein